MDFKSDTLRKLSPKKSKFISTIFGLAVSLFCTQASAVATEIGVNYNYKKTFFDDSNNSEQQAIQSSVSFYFWERLALEFSYTNGLFVQNEKRPNTLGAIQGKTTVYTDAYGSELILVFADRQAAFQPYIKGGATYVKRKQVNQDDSNNPWEISYTGLSPSYGLGLRFKISENLGIRTGFDVIQAPSVGDTKYDEYTGRFGLSIYL